MMETCYTLFGSNMGDKDSLFAQAYQLINNKCGQVVGMSSAYISEPWGFEADEWFLNRVIAVATELNPEEMLCRLLDIETKLGRIRHPKVEAYTSRTVDLDILYFGNQIIHSANLKVPHLRLHLRRFALVPLCEMIPDFVHPVLRQTQRELLRLCPDQGTIRKTTYPC